MKEIKPQLKEITMKVSAREGGYYQIHGSNWKCIKSDGEFSTFRELTTREAFLITFDKL